MAADNFAIYLDDDDEQTDFRTVKMGLDTVCHDALLLSNIQDAVVSVSIVGYLASTMVRHKIYEALLFNDGNFVMPSTERLLAPYWNEVSG